MHLYANSMNILTRLQSPGARMPTALPQLATEVRKTPIRSIFELHLLGDDGSMSAGQWDGDARRHPGRRMTRESVPVRVEEEIEVVEPATFWG